MIEWARDHYKAIGRIGGVVQREPVPVPKPPLPRTVSAWEGRADLYAELEDLRVFIGECEADWRWNDRNDLAVRLRRDV